MITGWIASLGASVLLGRAKQALTGPMSGAIMISAIAVVGVLGLTFSIMYLTGKASRQATTACMSRVEADRLKRTNAALKDANIQAEATLLLRAKVIESIESRIAQTEKELEDARKLADTYPNACGVVFDANDPWLRGKQPAAKPAGNRR